MLTEKVLFQNRGLFFYYPPRPPPWFGKRPDFFSEPFPELVVWDTFSSDDGEPLVAGGANRIHGTNHGEEPACFDELLHKRTHCICILQQSIKKIMGQL